MRYRPWDEVRGYRINTCSVCRCYGNDPCRSCRQEQEALAVQMELPLNLAVSPNCPIAVVGSPGLSVF